MRFLRPEDHQLLFLACQNQYTVEFEPYDWNLNSQAAARRAVRSLYGFWAAGRARSARLCVRVGVMQACNAAHHSFRWLVSTHGGTSFWLLPRMNAARKNKNHNRTIANDA
jgi:hypothetical protein